MGSELTTNGEALRLFFTDDIYLIKGEEGFSTEEVLRSVVQEVELVSAVVSGEAIVPDSIQEVVPVMATTPSIDKKKTLSGVSSSPATPASTVIPQLTTTPVQIPAIEKTAALPFKFLGKNKKKILILVNDAEHEVSDELGRELLRKIVKSINLSANDFALLNYANYPQTSFTALQQYFSSVLVFAFGVSPSALQLSAQSENKIVMEGDVRLIFTAELRKLEQDPVGKKELWGSLKQLGL
ncbi:hypothetical protein [Pedobacter gandavensis]|uniref:hypothetical protein n=1 Tax=Pedobacter gandavensis TaxID=2679963 RepID=UPI00292E90E0|nr:hypothetical protein [Pedobacter gandavensis]